jgi:hypothetical protein
VSIPSSAFGNESRIDRINLLEFMDSRRPPIKVLYSFIIQDAVCNYLYAFLGKNGTNTEEFFSAWQYFFNVSSTNKNSWDHNRRIKLIYTHNNQKVIKNHYLTDSECELMCFDKHYEFSGLSEHMHIDKFRAGLKTKRRQILTDNWTQVTCYITKLYQKELSEIADYQQIPLQIWNEDLMTVLIDPPSPIHLANLLLVPSKLKRPKRSKVRKDSVSPNIRIVESITNPGMLEPNWGPLSELGVKNG